MGVNNFMKKSRRGIQKRINYREAMKSNRKKKIKNNSYVVGRIKAVKILSTVYVKRRKRSLGTNSREHKNLKKMSSCGS